MATYEFEIPKWMLDFDADIGIRSTFVLSGNVSDLQMEAYENDCMCVTLNDFLLNHLASLGYDEIAFYNRTEGFHDGYGEAVKRLPGEEAAARSGEGIGRGGAGEGDSCDFESAAIRIVKWLSTRSAPSAVIFDLATTAVESPVHLSNEERQAFSQLFLLSRRPLSFENTPTGKMLTNLLILIANKANDVPSWFYIDNPYVRHLDIAKPTRSQRLFFAAQPSTTGCFCDYMNLSEGEQARFLNDFANLTEGMSVLEIKGFVRNCGSTEGMQVLGLREAIDRYRYGQTRDYWSRLDRDAIRRAEDLMRSRIKGQDAAIAKAVDVLCRAAAGLTLSGGASGSAKPKGVLFLAGPTGTGKTELAKAITEAVFSDESQMIRFDMSEFGERHSDQRLFGAPPGYVGYDEGGELTNAVRSRPFSLLLFDEIEKADSSILDKFLQIIDDGRLTDSHGETVYFGQTIIVFTSNLGMTEKDSVTGRNVVSISTDTFSDADEFHQYVVNRIRESTRPEFFNRVGEKNFVVFDFIDADIAMDIMRSKLAAFAKNLEKTRSITLGLSGDLLGNLLEAAVSKAADGGGRGVMNCLQEHVVDPLSRLFIQEGVGQGERICLMGCPNGSNPASLALELKRGIDVTTGDVVMSELA